MLLGIVPQSAIAFVSETWGGCVSDKHLTEHSGFLNKLLPGDIVLADRGFDIAEAVGMIQASLHIPAFTKGKDQLSAIEVKETRTIANVRIHVERVIGMVRQKYSILHGTILSRIIGRLSRPTTTSYYSHLKILKISLWLIPTKIKYSIMYPI